MAKTRTAPLVKAMPILNTGKPSNDKSTKVKWFKIRKSCPSQDHSEHRNGSSLKLTGKKPKSRCAEGTDSDCDENVRVETTSDAGRTEANGTA